MSSAPNLIWKRQLAAAIKVVPFANILNLVSSCVIGLFGIPASQATFRICWTLAAAGTAAHSIQMWFRRWSSPHHERTRREQLYLTGESLAWAVLYGTLTGYLLPLLDEGQRVLVLCTLAGWLGASTIALAPMAAVGIVNTIANAAAMGIAISLQPQGFYRVVLFQLTVYAGALTVGNRLMSASFRSRCVAEEAAAAGRQTVALLLDDLEDGSRDWLWETDCDGRFTRVSERFAEVAGTTRSELRSMTLVDLLTRLAEPGTGSPVPAKLETALRQRREFRRVGIRTFVAGDHREWSLSAKPIDPPPAAHAGSTVSRHSSPPGIGAHWRGVGSDITAEKRQRDEILRLANTDSLTDLPNRRQFTAAVQQRIDALPPGGNLTLAILDLDNFKSVNDTLGHGIGDDLLVEIAYRMTDLLASDEFCGRLGGDEFAIALPGDTDPQQRLAEYLDVLSAPVMLSDGLIEVRGSIGYALFPEDAQSLDELVMSADLALFAAKDSGRNRIRRFDGSLRLRAEARATALNELGAALRHDQFEVHYQPQLGYADGRVLGFEALVRWNHPTNGMISPAQFITVAEETGLIVPIGSAVLYKACRTAMTWQSGLVVSVNLSPAQLMSADIVSMIAACLKETGLPPHRLELEVTESAVVDDAASEALLILAAMGIRIAIDDFGTGYSSLAALHALPIDRIKIDRSFVAALSDDVGGRTRTLLTAMVDMAAALGMDVLAEGVETATQSEILRSIGCDSYQGYLCSRPMPEAAVAGFLLRQSESAMGIDLRHVAS